ncbi:MAG: hypothetical protein NXI04_00235 [Planctomycetaceae bacterium]|nr:hypothetical protein [Planctomycetaceae bacterium]
MSHATALGCSVLRCLAVATVALPLSAMLWRYCFSSQAGWRRRLATAAAVAPLFVPDLLIGFTYRLTSARLLHSDVGTELLYAGLLLLRVTGLQVVARLLLPVPAGSLEAMHSWRLLNDGTRAWAWQWVRLNILGRYRAAVVAWLAGSLLCFQEFETAALVQINQLPVVWTVWLFDAFAAGEPLSLSLQHVAWAMGFQLLLLSPALVLLRAAGSGAAGGLAVTGAVDAGAVGGRAAGSGRSIERSLSVLVLLAVVTAAVLIPVWTSSGQIVSGLALLWQQGTLLSRIGQVLQSVVTSVLAAVLALWICRDLVGRGVLSLLFLSLGLCGSLVLSLVMLAFFQLPIIRVVYDTYIPMVATQTLWLLPRAWLLLMLLRVLADSESLHSAGLLLASADAGVSRTARVTLWRLGRIRWLLAVSLLTHWSFWDVSIVSLLRPVQFEPVVTRLYNEMHYGRTDTLIAMTVLSVVMPFCLALLAGLLMYALPFRRLGRSDTWGETRE